MTPHRHGSARIEYPNDLEIVLTREFDAPIQLVFDVLTKPEHVRKTFAPYGEQVTVCSIDLRVGGNYGLQANYDNVADLLRSLLDSTGTVAG